MRLTAGAWVAIAATVLALIFGALWFKDRDDRIRAEGQVSELQEARDSAAAEAERRVAASDSAAVEARREATASDSASAALASALERERRARGAAQARAAEAILRAAGLADTIVVTAASGDTAAVRRAVDTLLANVAEERAGWAAVARSDSMVIVRQASTLAQHERTIAQFEALDVTRVRALTAMEARAVAAEALAEAALRTAPGWFERNAWWIAGGAGIAIGWTARDKLDEG
jgi:hypothetical protein